MTFPHKDYSDHHSEDYDPERAAEEREHRFENQEYELGWQVSISDKPFTTNNKGFSKKYFLYKKEAQNYIKSLDTKKVYYRMENSEEPVKKCKCGRYYEENDLGECLLCDKLRGDIQE